MTHWEGQGGYLAAKHKKLEKQLAKDNGKKSDLFRNLVFWINGYTEPSAEDLKVMIVENGGKVSHTLSPKTTHIIAQNLPKCKNFLTKKKRIVLPSWVVDSISNQKILGLNNHIFLGTTNNVLAKPIPVCQKDSKDSTIISFTIDYGVNVQSDEDLKCLITTLTSEILDRARTMNVASYEFVTVKMKFQNERTKRIIREKEVRKALDDDFRFENNAFADQIQDILISATESLNFLKGISVILSEIRINNIQEDTHLQSTSTPKRPKNLTLKLNESLEKFEENFDEFPPSSCSLSPTEGDIFEGVSEKEFDQYLNDWFENNQFGPKKQEIINVTLHLLKKLPDNLKQVQNHLSTIKKFGSEICGYKETSASKAFKRIEFKNASDLIHQTINLGLSSLYSKNASIFIK